ICELWQSRLACCDARQLWSSSQSSWRTTRIGCCDMCPTMLGDSGSEARHHLHYYWLRSFGHDPLGGTRNLLLGYLFRYTAYHPELDVRPREHHRTPVPPPTALGRGRAFHGLRWRPPVVAVDPPLPGPRLAT